MLAGNWFNKKRFFSSKNETRQPLKKGLRRKQATCGRNLRVEELEDRRMLATYIVNNLGDLNPAGNVVVGSLRDAIRLSNNSQGTADTIVFADYLFTDPDTRVTIPGVITLDGRPNGGQLSITDNVEILGPGSGTLTIETGGPNFRIFDINIASDEEVRPVTIGGVTLSGGSLNGTADDDANRGGAIINREGLTLVETIIVGNSASWGGGAIYSPIGGVNVSRSLIIGNNSGGGGGAILLGEGDDELRPGLVVTNSTFTQNSTFGQFERPGFGGAIYNRSGNVEITSSTFTGNSSSAGGGAVATHGVDVEDLGVPIRSGFSHNILFGNSTGISPDDIFGVRRGLEGEHLAPTMLIDGAGRGYNFIGAIGGALWLDPDDEGEDHVGHFYQVISLVDEDGESEGITWSLANRASSHGQAAFDGELFQGSHLAALSSDLENELVFTELVDDPILWSVFQPEDFGDPAVTPPPEYIGPWLGGRQVEFNAEPDGGWQWLSDPVEVFALDLLDPDNYHNWEPSQPNDGVRDPAEPGPAENFLSFFGVDTTGVPVSTWGDLLDEPEGDGETPVSYVIEYDQGTNFFNADPGLLDLGDYGGATPTFYPNSASGSPVIDAGARIPGPDEFEQRGSHFSRLSGGAIDIGAVEVQNGVFVVDELLDETDGQYVTIDPSYIAGGDFSLREAIEFSEKNPEFDTILFSDALLGLPDLTPSHAPTILLKLTDSFDPKSALGIASSVNIVGPTGFELEIDATGNDFSPTVNNADGTRIFMIDNGDASTASDISISGLTLLGSDVIGTGGAILNRENLTLSAMNLKENYATDGGGGISTHNGELLIEGSALFNNTAGSDGGALLVDQAGGGGITKATVRNTTISGNFATRGGGILNNDAELFVEFSTITDNTSPLGAGIGNLNRPDTFTQLRSSIVSANQGNDITILQGAVPNVHSLGYNLIGTGNALSVFSESLGDLKGVTNPMISALVVDGGFNPVHRLLAGSPAIDAGDTLAIAGVDIVPVNDQRGNPFTRVFDGLRDTKERIDIGAYELQGSTFIVDTPLDENDGNISAGNLSLREAIELSNANPLTDTIMFDAVAMQGATIFQNAMNSPFLSPGTPTDMRITDSVNIIGLGENLLTLDGSGALTDFLVPILPDGTIPASRFFTIDDGDSMNQLDVYISGLKFTNSFEITANGASIHSVEDLKLESVTLIDNGTLGDGYNGGAIFQQGGNLELVDVLVTANRTDGVDSDGGGLYVLDGNLTIRNSVISGNATAQTLGSGGGLYLRGSTLNMEYSYISANVTPGGEADGAGIFGRDSVLNINNSYITGNSMTGSNSEGAGIFVKDSALTLTSSLVALNTTTGSQSEGAGIYLNGGSATIDRSTISLNTSSGHSASGAGIAVVDGQLLVKSSTLDRNQTTGASASGGSLHNLGGDVTILDSTISGSSVDGLSSQGGAVFSETTFGTGDKTLIVNSTISGNSATASGGGVYNASGTTEIRHSTITNNSVPFFGNGGGVASRGDAGTTNTKVYSSIIAGNFSTSDPVRPISDVDSPAGAGQNSFESLGYNVIGKGLPLALDTFVASGDQSDLADPMLGILNFNGGPTLVHSLQEGSPAVNAGDPNAVPGFGGTPLFDQRGVGFDRELGGRMDVGAAESPYTPVIAADFDNDGDVDGADFLAWQRGFGKPAASSSDGDANGDNVVDAIDLGIWQSDYGVGTAPVVAPSMVMSFTMSTEDSQEAAPVVPAFAAVSEPLAASDVLSSSSFVSGLTLDPITGGDDGSTAWFVESQMAEAADVAAKDDLFSALPQSVGSLDVDDLEEGDSTSGEETEETAEDRFFDLLGSSV